MMLVTFAAAIRFLDKAIKKNKTVVWAYGVAGFAAAAFIAVNLLGKGLWAALYIGVTIGLGILVYAFSALIAARSRAAVWAGLVLLWTSVLAFVAFAVVVILTILGNLQCNAVALMLVPGGGLCNTAALPAPSRNLPPTPETVPPPVVTAPPARTIVVSSASWGHGLRRFDVTDRMKQLCQGKVTCEFMVNKDYFGPVPGASEPYDLFVQYSCAAGGLQSKPWPYGVPATITCL